MKYVFTSLRVVLFLLIFTWAVMPSSVWAASSDDAVNTNYMRRDPEDYNYLPLVLRPNESTGNTGALRDIISFNMAYDQGYEVQCAKPNWKITPQVYGAIKEYFELYNSPVTLSNSASYNADFGGGRIPLFRGDEDLTDTTKISSYEGFFGADYLKDAPPETNSSGVTNLLLNQAGQCAVKYNNLKSLFDEGSICDKLSDESECSLKRDIEGTGYTTESLFFAMAGLFKKSNGERNLNCGDITGGWTDDLLDFGITEKDFAKDVEPIAKAVSLMPLNLDVLYRLAFLIIAPQQKISTGDDIFQFLQNQSPLPNLTSHTPVNEELQAPIVIGFKVPFVATNSIFSLPGLRDSSLLTADLSREFDQIESLQEDAEKERGKFVQAINANKTNKPLIDCEGLPQCTGNDSSQAVLQALIDLVNGSGASCGGFKGPYENAGDLGSPTETSDQKNFQDPYATPLMPISNSAGFSWTLQVRDENVKSDLGDETTPVSAYLITPYGTDLQYLENSLKSIFFSDIATQQGELSEWEKLVQNNCIPDFNGECGMIPEYLTFGSILADLDSGSDKFTFFAGDPTKCENIVDPIAKAQCEKEDTKSFGATLIEKPRDPLRILGGKVGWLIKQIQLKLRDVNTKAHEYISSCERTEDLFLGRCLGYQGKPGGQDSSAPNSCNDFLGLTVDLPTMDELKKMTCSIANNDADDAQLLWGLMQIEGSPFLRRILAGDKEMSCSDIIINDCGASQIVGVLIPQCIDVAGCPQAEKMKNDTTDPWIQESRENPDIACDIRTSMEYVLRKRKSERSWLIDEYKAVNGVEPSTEQLYYMMAGRNYGVTMDYLTQPACGDYEETSGCGGANYCVCTMDTFPFSCDGI
ncbi:MAG: hypothetical protein ABII10_02695 [Candidatus Paceibacterota bacterium]